MAQLIWKEPAVSDLNEIAEYIALENPVNRVYPQIDRLKRAERALDLGQRFVMVHTISTVHPGGFQ